MNNKLLASIFLLIFFHFSGILCSQMENRTEFSIEAGQYGSEELEESITLKTNKEEASSQVRAKALHSNDGVWTIIFHFPEAVTFHREVKEDSLYLEFNQPVDSTDLIIIQEKIGSLIKRFANGYNSLYLIAKRPVVYQTSADGMIFILNISPDECAPLEMTRSAEIALARILIENRVYQSSFEMLFDLIEEYPKNKDLLVLYASLEGLIPRWQNQVSILENLHADYPLDEDIRTLMFDAFSPHSSNLKIERQMQRTVGLAAVQVYLAQNETITKTTPDFIFYTGEQYQLWDGHIASIVNSEGIPVGFRGWRSRGALYMRNEWRNGDVLKAFLYDQKCAFGAGVEYSTLAPCLQGHFATEIQWHRPSWEVFEGLAYHGREDRFYSIIDSTYNRYFAWSLGGGVRRIGITGTPNGFSSALANAGMSLSFMIVNPIIGISYNLDAEYILSHYSKIGADGTSFYPVPYTSFENHTLRAFGSYIFRDRWYFSAYAGETMNRIGLNDFTCGAELRYQKPMPCGWEAKISYNRFPSTIVSGATAEFLTATLLFRY